MEDRKRDEKERLQELVEVQTKVLTKELQKRITAEQELKLSFEKLEKSRLAELNLMQDLQAEILEKKQTEKELRRSRKEFQSYFESGAIGMSVTSSDKKWIEVNQRLCKMLGYSKNELKEVNWADLSHPDDLASNLDLFQQAVDGKIDKYEIDKRFIRKNGTILYVNLSVVCQRNEDGTLHHIISSHVDITKRKLAEDSLKQSEERFRSLYENAPIGVYRTTPDGQILLANPVLVKMLGYKSFKELKHRDLTQEKDYEPQYSRAEFLEKIDREGEVKGLETSLIRKDGSTFFIRESAILIRDNFGKPLYLDGTIEDITEQKLAEKALKESNEFKTSLLKTLPFGMDIVDETGNILFLSERFIEMFGNQAIGKKCWELYLDDKTQCMDCPLYKGIEIGITDNYESRGVLGGKIFDISHTGMMFGGKKAMLEIFQDITERKRKEAELIIAKEKAEESDRLKYAFGATMNHELRTPLNHILGFSSLIQYGVDAEDSKDYAATIETSGRSLLSIIEDIFELALFEQADIRLRRQTFSMMDHFMENKVSLEDILQSSGKYEQIKLIFKPDMEFLSGFITADRSKINQVLANLFKNAIKFTNSGSIEFGFNLRNHGKLMFYVKDTGIGIPKEKQAIIFDYFRQADDSHTRLYGGIGVGLAISLKITNVLNGELTVESEAGKGSTFCLIVPVEPADTIITKETASQRKAELDLTDKTILIVEDDPISMMLIRSYMQTTNAWIIEASEGAEAVRNCHAHPEIDLVLMDLKMPGMDGFEATSILKSQKPGLPIIALTAYSLTSDKLKAIDAGCNSIVTKPLDKSILFGEIKRLLS